MLEAGLTLFDEGWMGVQVLTKVGLIVLYLTQERLPPSPADPLSRCPFISVLHDLNHHNATFCVRKSTLA